MSNNKNPKSKTMFYATEFNSRSLIATGKVEQYLAENAKQAVKSLLYTRLLTDGKSTIAKSKSAVHSNDSYWLVSQYPLVLDSKNQLLPQRHLSEIQISTLKDNK
jgi:hypothetical protein